MSSKTINQPQSAVGYVSFGLLIFLIIGGVFEDTIKSDFLSKLLILSLFICIGTSLSIMWKYAIPEEETFKSRFFSCLKDGFLVVIVCSILTLILVWLFNINNEYLIIFFVILTLLLGVAGNKKIKRGEKTFERTWVDATVITLAQMILAFTVVVLIAIILNKITGQKSR